MVGIVAISRKKRRTLEEIESNDGSYVTKNKIENKCDIKKLLACSAIRVIYLLR
jgi:hypothetical protein